MYMIEETENIESEGRASKKILKKKVTNKEKIEKMEFLARILVMSYRTMFFVKKNPIPAVKGIQA